MEFKTLIDIGEFSTGRVIKSMERIEKPLCDLVTKFEIMAKIGQGTFGEVFKARHRITKELVALKKVLMENEKEGFPITALREIKILMQLKHENVVSLKEICRTEAPVKNGAFSHVFPFHLVFEFCEHDLAGLIRNTRVVFSLPAIKEMMKQLLGGLYFIHCNKILHRDMKSANILICKSGILKIADFGLARAFSDFRKETNRYTNRVVTLWYRPPELLLGARNYGPSIDLWGAGCIMAEMWTRAPIMQGSAEQHQLKLISQLCGSINPETMPGIRSVQLYNKIELPKNCKRKVKEKLWPRVRDIYAVDLLDQLLILDPKKRISSDRALDHDFFWKDPLPCKERFTQMFSDYNHSMFELFSFSSRKNEQSRLAAMAEQNRNNVQLTAANSDDQYVERVF